jgi:alkylation response protein AidB-like acyl-CoA dehydrogenase
VRFALDDVQTELSDTARRFLADRFPIQRVSDLIDSETGWDPKSWSNLADLGWLGVSVSEELGGAGLGFLEEAVLFEETGRALLPGPFFSTVGLALPLLPPERQAEVAAGTARWSVAGSNGLTPDLALVDHVVTVAGNQMVAVPAEGVTSRGFDRSRRYGRLGTVAGGTPLGPAALLIASKPRMWAAVAVEACGVANAALELAVDYAKERHQFGRPIGSFQAVAHPLATAFMRLELSRSLAYWAAWCVAVGDHQAAAAAAAAKAEAADVAVSICETAIQVLGGIGMTWEHPVHRYYRRALWASSFDESPAQLRQKVADAVLGPAA